MLLPLCVWGAASPPFLNQTQVNNQEKKLAVVLANARFHVHKSGELIATEDNKRFFVIDGMISLASANDQDELDVIKPYQITVDGKQTYYKAVCETAEHADGNTGRADEGNSGDKPLNYFELEEKEDPEDFLKDMDRDVKGCLYKIAAILLSIALFFSIVKYFHFL